MQHRPPCPPTFNGRRSPSYPQGPETNQFPANTKSNRAIKKRGKDPWRTPFFNAGHAKGCGPRPTRASDVTAAYPPRRIRQWLPDLVPSSTDPAMAAGSRALLDRPDHGYRIPCLRCSATLRWVGAPESPMGSRRDAGCPTPGLDEDDERRQECGGGHTQHLKRRGERPLRGCEGKR